MAPEERRRLAEAARKAGLPLGTWLRSVGLAAARRVPRKYTREELRQRAEILAKVIGSISHEEAEAMREEYRKSRAEPW
jgi:hypothetical protein